MDEWPTDLGGRLQEVFAYEGQTAWAKFLSQPRMGWHIILF